MVHTSNKAKVCLVQMSILEVIWWAGTKVCEKGRLLYGCNKYMLTAIHCKNGSDIIYAFLILNKNKKNLQRLHKVALNSKSSNSFIVGSKKTLKINQSQNSLNLLLFQV